jgi:mono/diheme cytochrome c family protein/plastocyanin
LIFSNNMKPETLARITLGLLLAGILVGAAAARILDRGESIELHGQMAEAGGWTPDVLHAQVGKPLLLRIVSDDVVHGFAVGRSDQPAVDVAPGEEAELTLNFDQPGEYTFYCTRWCGLNHWRMRGTIQVAGDEEPVSTSAEQPLYVELGLDIDGPHKARLFPPDPPGKGSVPAEVELEIGYLSRDYYQAHSPEQVFGDLRADSDYAALTDEDVWELVAQVWAANTSHAGLERGKQLYRQNCAACHGESGQGDGVFAEEVSARFGQSMSGMDHVTGTPTDFTDTENMYGASPALLQGKIIRGGMGTGMPYWGPIFTDEQTWDLVAYLYTFTMNLR